MPVHCFSCNYAGYPDEFDFFNQIVVLCDICYGKAVRRQREILRKDIRRVNTRNYFLVKIINGI